MSQQVSTINYKIRNFVPFTQKNKLIALVFVKQQKIKHAALKLNIPYPTAKHIIAQYRKTKILKKPIISVYQKRCHYKPIRNDSNQIQFICSRGGIE